MLKIGNISDCFKNYDNHILVFKNIFSDFCVDILTEKIDKKTIDLLAFNLCFLTNGKNLSHQCYKQKCLKVCVSTENINIIFNKKDETVLSLKFNRGDIFIIGKKFQEKFNFKIPQSCIKLYHLNLPDIYTTIKKRIRYGLSIKEKTEKIKVLNKDIKNFCEMNLIGKGDYGNVFLSEYLCYRFAVKATKMGDKKPESLNLNSNYHELYILKDIFKPLIEKNICPNLPYLYDSFFSEKKELVLRSEKINCPCVLSILELADGDLKKYLQKSRKIEELNSCLFQIMAGLHCIQHYPQIMNFDIKKENVLYYNTSPSGYWCYTIKGEKYYVPNYGKLFILNDFGISRTMSPSFKMYKNDNEKTFRLGSRFGVIKDNLILPLNVEEQKNGSLFREKSPKIKWTDNDISKGAEFRINRETDEILTLECNDKKILDFLKSKEIEFCSEKFFNSPEIIPPFEFYNDTQDVLRMFVGGKRTTQRGNHSIPKNIPQKFSDNLKKYVGVSECCKSFFFSKDPSQLMAGYFIKSFFQDYKNKPKNCKILDNFYIS